MGIYGIYAFFNKIFILFIKKKLMCKWIVTLYIVAMKLLGSISVPYENETG